MSLDQFVPVLQLSIGPVIMISGTGLVLLSMTNRIARVIDRARRLAESLRSGSSSETHRIQGQLIILARRGRMLRLAVAFTSTSLLLAAFLVIALFLVVLLDLEAALLIVAIFISCMASLVIGLIYFIADVNASLSALKLDIGVENYDDYEHPSITLHQSTNQSSHARSHKYHKYRHPLIKSINTKSINTDTH